MSHRLDIARKNWGDVPKWITALIRACDATSQNKVAKRLGITASTVSQAISNSYQGRMDRLEVRVRSVYIDADVTCPAIGIISAETCMGWRDVSGTLLSTSPNRARMFRACGRCPHNMARSSEAPEIPVQNTGAELIFKSRRFVDAQS
ncbi:MAG: hypothetical protein HRU33_12415 [Rhodobacteraceae bacterium]|nr:hypothetical protein [Paracoccaceae bacterium]